MDLGPVNMLLLLLVSSAAGLNLPPFFTADMNQFTLVENTPVGSPVYTLQGQDPEGSRIKFGIQGTDKFVVDSSTGVVTVAQPIDRESQTGISDNEIRLVALLIRQIGKLFLKCTFYGETFTD